MDGRPWYGEGLRFECTRCGHCCGGGPGTVLVDDDEIAALARRLDMEIAGFRERYTRTLDGGAVSLQEKSNYECIFYDSEAGCTVYEDRPTQCRTWPFWRANVRSKKAWERAARHCKGMNQGRLYRQEEIEARASDDGTSLSLPTLQRWTFRLGQVVRTGLSGGPSDRESCGCGDHGAGEGP